MRDMFLKILYEVDEEYKAFGLKEYCLFLQSAGLCGNWLKYIILPTFNNDAKADSWESTGRKMHSYPKFISPHQGPQGAG